VSVRMLSCSCACYCCCPRLEPQSTRRANNNKLGGNLSATNTHKRKGEGGGERDWFSSHWFVNALFFLHVLHALLWEFDCLFVFVVDPFFCCCCCYNKWLFSLIVQSCELYESMNEQTNGRRAANEPNQLWPFHTRLQNLANCMNLWMNKWS